MIVRPIVLSGFLVVAPAESCPMPKATEIIVAGKFVDGAEEQKHAATHGGHPRHASGSVRVPVATSSGTAVIGDAYDSQQFTYVRGGTYILLQDHLESVANVESDRLSEELRIFARSTDIKKDGTNKKA